MAVSFVSFVSLKNIVLFVFVLGITFLGLTSYCSTETQVPDHDRFIWHHPASLADNISPPGQDARTPSVAIDDNGNAVVTWSQYDGKYWRTFKSEYLDNKWLNPASLADALSPVEGGNTENPRVAMGANGDIVIVWEQNIASSRYIFMAEKRGGKWQVPLSIGEHISPGEQFAWEPDVAMADNGDTVIVWSQELPVGLHGIFKSEYRNGSWQHPSSLTDSISSTIVSGDGLRPRVVMNNQDEALVVWEQDPGGVSHIYMSEHRNGKWMYPVDDNDFISPQVAGSRGAHFPLPAIKDNGRAVIAWQQSHGSKDRIYMSEYQRGAWQHPGITEAVSPQTVIAATINDVGMNASGNIIILWNEQQERKQTLHKTEYRDNRKEDSRDEESVVMSKTDFDFRVIGKVAMSDSGKAIIISQQMGDDRVSRLFLSEYNNNSWPWPGDKISLADQPANGFSADASRSGSFVVVWIQNDGEYDQVYKSEFRLPEK